METEPVLCEVEASLKEDVPLEGTWVICGKIHKAAEIIHANECAWGDTAMRQATVMMVVWETQWDLPSL